MSVKLLFVACALSAVAGLASAQTSSHERIGVESADFVVIRPSTFAGFSTSQDAAGSTKIFVSTNAAVVVEIQNKWHVTALLPFVAGVSTDTRAPLPAAGAVGDPLLEVGYTLHAGDWRLGFGAFYQQPFGIWNPYQSQMLRISSGSGYPTIGASIAATRLVDPIVLALRLLAETTLPRQDRFGTSFCPLDLEVMTLATAVLNSSVALSASVTNSVHFPTIENGQPISDYRYRVSAAGSVVFATGESRLTVGLSKLLSDPASAVGFDLAYDYAIRFKENTK